MLQACEIMSDTDDQLRALVKRLEAKRLALADELLADPATEEVAA